MVKAAIIHLKNGRPCLKGPEQLLIDARPCYLARVIELGIAGPPHHLYRYRCSDEANDLV